MAKYVFVSSVTGIRPKAVAVIRRGDDLLLSFAIDPSTGERYGRLLGGGIELGERAEDALRRELREELGAETHVTGRLGVLENVYVHAGVTHHEIVFVFEAAFVDLSLYDREAIVVDEGVCDGPALWVPIAALRSGAIRIYPGEIAGLL